MPQMARLVSLLVMAAVIVLLGLTFYQVITPFLLPLFLAGVLAMLCQPFYRRCLVWTKNRPPLAAGVTTVIVLAMILVPLSLSTVAAAKQLYLMAQTKLKNGNMGGPNWADLANSVRNSAPFEGIVHRYEDWTGDEVDRDLLEVEIKERLRDGSVTLSQKTLGYYAGTTFSVLGSAVSILVASLTFVIAFYYFLADGPALIDATEKMIPVHRDYVRRLLMQFDQAVRAVVLATFAAALGQGVSTGMGMYLAGYHHFFMITLLATLTALVPLLGTWLIWGPFALWLGFHEGHWATATALALYGSIFVGLLDNVIRAYVLNSNVKLHPLLAFVSVLGGIEVMGLWGVFIGPIVASCLHALVKIFNTELVDFSLEKQTGKVVVPNDATLPLQGAQESKPVAATAAPPAPTVASSTPPLSPPIMSPPAA